MVALGTGRPAESSATATILSESRAITEGAAGVTLIRAMGLAGTWGACGAAGAWTWRTRAARANDAMVMGYRVEVRCPTERRGPSFGAPGGSAGRRGEGLSLPFDPGSVVLRVLELLGDLGHVERPERVHHHGEFVGVLGPDGGLGAARM